jgi:hypothetical protein
MSIMLKLNSLKPEVCRYCRQDILRDCTPEARAAAGEPCPVATIAKLTRIAESAGLSCAQIIRMLEEGASIGELGEIVLARLGDSAR